MKQCKFPSESMRSAQYCIFFSTCFAVFFTPYHLFSIPLPPLAQLFSTPPIFLYLPYSTPIGGRSLLRHYVHPFGLYKRSLQPAHSSPPASGSHLARLPPPGPPPHTPSGPTRPVTPASQPARPGPPFPTWIHSARPH